MSLTRGFGWNLAFHLVTRIATPVIALLLMRRLSPEVFGMYGVLQATMLIADTFREAGLAQSFLKAREVGPELERRYVARSVQLGLVLAVVLGLLAWPAARLYDRPELGFGFLFAAVATFLNGPATIPYAKLLRRADFRKAGRAEAIASVGSSLFSLAAVYAGLGFLGLAAGLVVRSVLFLGLTQRAAPTTFVLMGGRGGIGRESGTLTATSLLWTLYSMGDQPLVAKLLGLAAGGLFGSAKMIVQTADVLAKPVLQTTSVAFAQRNGDPVEVGRTFYKALAAFLLVVAPVYVLVGLFAGPLVRSLLPESYHGTASILPALCVYGAAIYPGSFASSALLMADRAGIALRHWCIGFVLLGGVFVLRPPQDLVGLAWLFAAGLVAINLATLVYAFRTYPPTTGKLIPAAGVLAVTAGVAVAISSLPVPDAAQLGLAVAILPLAHAIMIGAAVVRRPFAALSGSGASEIWQGL